MTKTLIRSLAGTLGVLAVAALAGAQPGGPGPDPVPEVLPYELMRAVTRPDTGALLARELNETPDPQRLRAYHDLLASEPHDAGTPGDARVVDEIARLMTEFGLTVEKQAVEVYLSRPVAGEVFVSAADIAEAGGLALETRERAVEGDPFSARTDTRPGWNAYSGTGDVTGEVVYANYGRLEDFRQLAELGVDVRGKVVLARFGGNFRGFKAKYAQEAGAAGLVMFTDPADDGWGKGLSYPEGGYANETHIQRGSLKTLDYPGDPLTPFEPAIEGARRLNPERVDLPTIPVQPIGWGAAEEILSRMTGPSVPEGWQGGLPFRYRLTGGEGLSVRVRVEQQRELVTTWNVIGRLEGSGEPQREVIIGCHHDAWGFGAGDPLAGMICLLESARSFGELAAQGVRPRRSVVFAAWGAEEHGIIGSVEYVESRVRELGQHAVAYLNLDMAAMGPQFRSSASPSLRAVIAEAAGEVPAAGSSTGTVLEEWAARAPDRALPEQPAFGDLGGGSDHIGFLCHACIPSASLGGGGTRGVSYHSIYDNLAWYRAVVGEDYEPALMVTRMTNAVAARLAHDAVLPLDPARYGGDVLARLGVIAGEAPEVEPSRQAIERSLGAGIAGGPMPSRRLADPQALGREGIERINADLMAIERDWCAASFDDGRRWYRNGYAAPDATSGYAAWILPGLRSAMAAGDRAKLTRQGEAVAWWVEGQQSRLRSIEALLRGAMPEEPSAGEDAPRPEFGRFEMEAVEGGRP